MIRVKKSLIYIMILLILLFQISCTKTIKADQCPELYFIPKPTRPILMRLNDDKHVGSVELQKEILSDMNLIVKYSLDLESTINGYEKQLKGIEEAKKNGK